MTLHVVNIDVQVLQAVSCSYQTASEEVMGSTSYQRSLSVDVSVSGGVAGIAKFSASTGFREVHEGTNAYRRAYVSSVARCIVYKANLNFDFSPFKVQRNSRSSIKLLLWFVRLWCLKSVYEWLYF